MCGAVHRDRSPLLFMFGASVFILGWRQLRPPHSNSVFHRRWWGDYPFELMREGFEECFARASIGRTCATCLRVLPWRVSGVHSGMNKSGVREKWLPCAGSQLLYPVLCWRLLEKRSEKEIDWSINSFNFSDVLFRPWQRVTEHCMGNINIHIKSWYVHISYIMIYNYTNYM